jgi:hypothetical protein
MSNIPQNKETFFSTHSKKQYLDFLGSPAFLTVIKDYALPPILFNELFTAHFMTIVAQSSGISDGSVKLEYITYQSSTYDNGYTMDVPGPRLKYGFCTTKNTLVQPGQSCHNTSTNINNPQYYHFKRNRQLRDFLDTYWKNMLHMSTLSHEDFSTYNFEIKFKKNHNKDLKNEVLYNDLIDTQYAVKSFLNWHFLNQSLQQENKNKIKKTKI